MLTEKQLLPSQETKSQLSSTPHHMTDYKYIVILKFTQISLKGLLPMAIESNHLDPFEDLGHEAACVQKIALDRILASKPAVLTPFLFKYMFFSFFPPFSTHVIMPTAH